MGPHAQLPRPKPSDRVRECLDCGWTSLCDGLAAIETFHMEFREGRGESRYINVRAGERIVQVAISPAGRSVRVFVDGNEV